MNNKIRLMYVRMLTSRMDRERFGHILVCSYDFRREEYEDYFDGVCLVALHRKGQKGLGTGT